MEEIKHIIRFLVVMLLQVLLFNNLQLLGVCQPFIYIVFLMMMPKTLPHWVDMLIGLAVGFIMDLFCNSLGVHMAACILIMFLRRKMISGLIMEHDRLRGEISSKTIGIQAFAKYAIVLVVIHHTTVFVLSAWSLAHIWMILLQIVVSSIITCLLILGYDLIRK